MKGHWIEVDSYDAQRHLTEPGNEDLVHPSLVLSLPQLPAQEAKGRLGQLCERLGLTPPAFNRDPLAIDCPFCGASAGDPCVTLTKRRATTTHADREHPPGVPPITVGDWADY